MDRKYFTTHRGVAAILLTKGYSIERITSEFDQRKNRQVTKIELDCDVQTGRGIGDEFFDGKMIVDAKGFYDKMGEVNRACRDASR